MKKVIWENVQIWSKNEAVLVLAGFKMLLLQLEASYLKQHSAPWVSTIQWLMTGDNYPHLFMIVNGQAFAACMTSSLAFWISTASVGWVRRNWNWNPLRNTTINQPNGLRLTKRIPLSLISISLLFFTRMTSWYSEDIVLVMERSEQCIDSRSQEESNQGCVRMSSFQLNREQSRTLKIDMSIFSQWWKEWRRIRRISGCTTDASG